MSGGLNLIHYLTRDRIAFRVRVDYLVVARAPVAQLDRVPDYGSGGWGFESSRARHDASPARRHPLSMQCPDARIGLSARPRRPGANSARTSETRPLKDDWGLWGYCLAVRFDVRGKVWVGRSRLAVPWPHDRTSIEEAAALGQAPPLPVEGDAPPDGAGARKRGLFQAARLKPTALETSNPASRIPSRICLNQARNPVA